MGLWSDQHAATIDLENFRGHNQYLEQLDDYPYEAMYEWATARGTLPLNHVEDGSFGCKTRVVDGVMVSRDLLDSVAELSFLAEVYTGQPDRVLDIGAGYGRFAHRLLETSEHSHIDCTDSILVSLRACERYRQHCRGRWGIVYEPAGLGRGYDLAVNIHSWSECTLDEVAWWLDKLVELEVPRIFIVPHHPDLATWSPNGVLGPSYRPAIETRGYKLAHEWMGPPCSQKAYQLWERT